MDLVTTVVGPRVAAPQTRSAGARVEDVLAVGRPAFWVVSVVPYYVGILLATHRLVPTVEDWPRLLVGAVVMGPLLWLAVLAINDAYDLPGDLLNPRKSKSPLLDGRVTLKGAKQLAIAAGIASIAVGLLVGVMFTLGVVLALVLGWAYSVPPLRLKTRPGWDIAVNAFVVGVLAPAAGWSITRPPWEFPWQFGLIGLLFAAALYVPTTVTDLVADSGAGDTTFAVRFGARLAYRLGIGLWVAALAFSMGCAWFDALVPRSTLVPQLFMVPVLAAAYAALTRRPTLITLALLSVIFGIPTIGFAVAYVGG